jgi:hypothetical protein
MADSILSIRSQGTTNTISTSVRAKIEDIRREVKNGVDGEGWHRVVHNWRSASQPHEVPKEKKAYRSRPSEVPKPPVQPASQYKRYESRFKNSEQNVESTIVNTIILGKLNKFSPQNYNEVYEFLSEILASGECDFLADFMKLIFTKAATEDTFCHLYARLLKELSAKYTFLYSEMNVLYKKFMDIFEEIDDDGDATQKRQEKKYRLGYSQFLAELLKNNVVEKTAFYETMENIIKQIDIQGRRNDKTALIEEYADCLTRIFNVLKVIPTATSPTATELKVMVRENLGEKIQELSRKSAERVSMNNKVRFAMMDCWDALK